MAGTVNISLQQQFDSQGLPLGGGLLYTYQSGTTTPQSAYKDIGLTIAHQNPVTLDASGRVPQMFFADGTIKLRLYERTGNTVIFEADFTPVLGASSGGAGGSSVDATTVFATGDLKHRYQDGSISGWVRANGLTIGSGSAAASERANADCQALFQYLWANDTSLAVSGGRGATAAADWAANKTITLPDMRGRTLAGMDTMNNGNASRIHTILASNVLGSVGGTQLYSIAQANLPAVAPTGSIFYSGVGNGTNAFAPAGNVTFSSTGTSSYTPAGSVGAGISGNGANVSYTDPGHIHANTVAALSGFGGAGGGNAPTGGTLLSVANSITNVSQTTGIVIPVNNIAAGLSLTAPTLTGTTVTASFGGTAITSTFTGGNLGSGTQMSIAQPTMVVTIYIKL